MPFEDEYYCGFYAKATGEVHPTLEKANTDYAHGYPLHFFRKNAVQRPLTTDKLFALKAVKKVGNSLGDMSVHLRGDEDVVLEAVKQDGLALRFAKDVLRREPHIVEAACASNGWALEHAALFFRKDRDLVLRCVASKPSAFQWAHADLRADRRVALAAVAGCGQALRWCSEALRDDERVVRTATGNDGSALQVRATAAPTVRPPPHSPPLPLPPVCLKDPRPPLGPSPSQPEPPSLFPLVLTEKRARSPPHCLLA